MPQVIGAARLIANEAILRKAWIRGIGSLTSLTGPEDLYSRVFGELDALHVQYELERLLPEEPALAEAIRAFLHRLQQAWFMAQAVYGASSGNSGWLLLHGDALLRSADWQKLRQEAGKVIVLAEAAGLRGSDFAPAG